MSAKVLIVDDEQDFLDIMAERLQDRGMDVSTATSAQDAIEKVKTESYDAVIMDFLMPEMDGSRAVKFLRETRSDLAIILLTANVREEERIAAKELGAMEVVEKPADLNLLTQLIKSARTLNKK